MIAAQQHTSPVHAFTLSLVDADGRLKYRSPALEALTGPSSDTSWFKLLRDEEAQSIRKQFAALVASGRGRARWVTRLRSASGAWRTVEVSANNLLADPLVRGVLLSFREVPR